MSSNDSGASSDSDNYYRPSASRPTAASTSNNNEQAAAGEGEADATAAASATVERKRVITDSDPEWPEGYAKLSPYAATRRLRDRLACKIVPDDWLSASEEDGGPTQRQLQPARIVFDVWNQIILFLTFSTETTDKARKKDKTERATIRRDLLSLASACRMFCYVLERDVAWDDLGLHILASNYWLKFTPEEQVKAQVTAINAIESLDAKYIEKSLKALSPSIPVFSRSNHRSFMPAHSAVRGGQFHLIRGVKWRVVYLLDYEEFHVRHNRTNGVGCVDVAWGTGSPPEAQDLVKLAKYPKIHAKRILEALTALSESSFLDVSFEPVLCYAMQADLSRCRYGPAEEALIAKLEGFQCLPEAELFSPLELYTALVEKFGPSIINIPTLMAQSTALHEAIAERNHVGVDFLMRHGADLEARLTRYRSKWLPLGATPIEAVSTMLQQDWDEEVEKVANVLRKFNVASL